MQTGLKMKGTYAICTAIIKFASFLSFSFSSYTMTSLRGMNICVSNFPLCLNFFQQTCQSPLYIMELRSVHAPNLTETSANLKYCLWHHLSSILFLATFLSQLNLAHLYLQSLESVLKITGLISSNLNLATGLIILSRSFNTSSYLALYSMGQF